jgi:DNA polymerase III epsilon subunit-like protein
MEILVIDIETTGFSPAADAIIEIGIVLVNTDTKKITTLFNKVVKDKNFDIYKHKNSWIFSNSKLTPAKILKAKPLSSYFNEIQSIFDKYPVTAFNKDFDMRFMRSRGFVCKDIKCLMITSMEYVHLKDIRGAKKKPTMQEAYNFFFPKEKYVERHRGLHDAKCEAKILLKMCELKSERIKMKHL